MLAPTSPLRASLRVSIAGLTLATATVSCDGDDMAGPSGRMFTLADAQQILQGVPVAVAELVDVHARVVQVARGTSVDGVTLTDLGGNEYEATLEWDLDDDGVLGTVSATATVSLDPDGGFGSGTIQLIDDADAGISVSGSFFAVRVDGSIDNPIYEISSDPFTIDARDAPDSNLLHDSDMTISNVDGTADVTYADAPVTSGSFEFETESTNGTVSFEPDGLGGWLIHILGYFGSMPFELTDDSPSRGAIEVTTSTSGSGNDPSGYLVTVADRTEAIGVSEVRAFLRLHEGNYAVEFDDISSNCTLTGDNPRDVTVVRGETTPVAFELECAAGQAGSWRLQASGVDFSSSRLLGVSFTDANTGWAVGCCRTGGPVPG